MKSDNLGLLNTVFKICMLMMCEQFFSMFEISVSTRLQQRLCPRSAQYTLHTVRTSLEHPVFADNEFIHLLRQTLSNCHS